MNKSESKYFNTAVRFDCALISLLEKKSFEYITVSEICAEAGVNRSTFYLHYENTCDLLDEATRYVMDKFISYFPVGAPNYSDCDPKKLNFISKEYLEPYLTFIKENKHLFSSVLSNPSTFKFENIFEKLFNNIFDPILGRFSYPQSERKYVMMFYLNGITAIIAEWLKDDCKKSIDEISEIIRYCIFGRSDREYYDVE